MKSDSVPQLENPNCKILVAAPRDSQVGLSYQISIDVSQAIEDEVGIIVLRPNLNSRWIQVIERLAERDG